MCPPLSHLPNCGAGGPARMPTPNDEPEGGPAILRDFDPRCRGGDGGTGCRAADQTIVGSGSLVTYLPAGALTPGEGSQ
jgi:hypothetical protein